MILHSIRRSDVVCRYGGDEFFIIFKNCMENTAEKIITRMYGELKKLESTASKPYEMSFSHGILSFNSESGYNTSNLLQEADRRMYACKKSKR